MCLVIFVRADHAANMAPAVGLRNGTAGPEPCRFQKNFGARLDHEGVIPGRLPVLPDRVGNIGRDMLLLRAAEHLNEIAIGADELLGGGLLAGICQTPTRTWRPASPSCWPWRGRPARCDSGTSAGPALPRARSRCRTAAHRSRCPRTRVRDRSRRSAHARRWRRARRSDWPRCSGDRWQTAEHVQSCRHP